MGQRRWVGLAGIAVVGVLLHQGVTAGMAEEDPIGPFRACGEITSELERLACFDRALAEAPAREARRNERRQRRLVEDFGLSDTQIVEREAQASESGDRPEPAASEESTVEVNSTLQEVFSDGSGKKVFLLANGQVWRETAGSSYRGIIRSGWPARVRRGGIGGYRLTFEDRVGFFKVERVR